MDSIKNVIPYLMVTVPPALLICFDTWIFEIITLASGKLEIEETAS